MVDDKAKQPSLPSIDPVILEMHTQNDRGAAIVGAAFLTEKLQEAIIDCWPPVSNTAKDRLFGGYGPLSSFAAQIDVAAAMGVLNHHSRADFHRIRRIRNLAAHLGTPSLF